MTEIVAIIVSLLSGIFWIATRFSTISSLEAKINNLEKRVLDLENKRNEDVLGFTKILGEFNVTLGRFDTTLKGINTTLLEVKETIKSHEQDIRKLLIEKSNER